MVRLLLFGDGGQAGGELEACVPEMWRWRYLTWYEVATTLRLLQAAMRMDMYNNWASYRIK
jgi:hypothetical protein